MSNIPFYFDHTPQYFRKNGWFKSENTFKFVHWAFSKCHSKSQKIVFDGKEISLQPYEFICGRNKSSSECFLTENAFRHQLNIMQKAGFIKKTTNSTTNRFNCYIWLTNRFLEDSNQLNNQQTTNKQPTEQPQDRTKKEENKIVCMSVACARENQENEMKELICMKSRKTQSGVTTDKRAELIEFLKNHQEHFTMEEILDSIDTIEKQDPTLNGTIKNYLIGTILKKREKTKHEQYTKHTNSRRSRNYDPVQRSAETFTKSSYSWGSEVG